jgi:hypothetical protein
MINYKKDNWLNYLAKRHFRLEEVRRLDIYYWLVDDLQNDEGTEYFFFQNADKFTTIELKKFSFWHHTKYNKILNFLYKDKLIIKENELIKIDVNKLKEILGDYTYIPF